MTTWILTATFLTTVLSQSIDIQDLTNNNGYLPIKLEDAKIIEHYNKVIHIVNTTYYAETLDLISKNIRTLNITTTETKTLLDTTTKNFILLKAKVENLIPHFRPKRGLVNVLGKGLKIIAGTMDSDDEAQINKSLKLLYNNQKALTERTDKLTYFNSVITSQIHNITNHINKKQILIETYLNEFKNYIQNKIATLEDEVAFMAHIYQINNDISLLKDHIDNIGQIIFSSKLGIIPSDVLTKTELNLIEDFDSYTNIKITVGAYDSMIMIILLIPQYWKEPLSKIIFEPIPNNHNYSISLENKEVLVDANNNIFNTNVKDNLKKNLIKLNDSCLTKIINFKTAQCNMEKSEKTFVTEIIPGILVFNNFYDKIKQNCNKNNINMQGNFLIKFQNCEITALNKTYLNLKIQIYDKFILPNIITKIDKKPNNITSLRLESLYFAQTIQEETIKSIMYQNKNSNIVTISIDIIIIFVIIILATTFFFKKKVSIFKLSSEPQANGGGVMVTPNIMITPNNII